jgi:hypothetical protein
MTPASAALTPFSLGSETTVGSSGVARFVAQQFEQGWRRLRDSNSLGAGFGTAFEDLQSVAQECSSPNWDGYGAAPVVQEAVGQAYRFLTALPLGTSAPSVGAEPDGHIVFEWYHSPRRTLSVSVSPEGELHYAALLGLRKIHGTEPFFGKVPQGILDLIRRVISA